MAEPQKIAKAFLVALDASRNPQDNTRVEVQFNPETLKVSLANQIAQPEGGGNQNGQDGQQFVGAGTMKLAVQVWFDVTVLAAEQKLHKDQPSPTTDVRTLTQKVAYFMTAVQSTSDRNKFTPPVARFEWGTFRFDGIMDSLEESLEFFSSDGRPLRASVSFSLAQQKITEFAFGTGAGAQAPPGAADTGQKPMDAAPANSSVQQLAAARGKGSDWKKVAAANNIENPRSLSPGQLLDMNPASLRPTVGASVVEAPRVTAALPRVGLRR